MRKFYFLTFIILVFFSCSKKLSTFSLQNYEIEKVYIVISENSFLMNDSLSRQLLSCLDNSEYAGIWKGIRREQVLLISAQNDTTKLHIMGEVFSVDTNWTKFYHFNCNRDFFKKYNDVSMKIDVDKNFQTMKRIFDDFVEFEDNTDSQDNKDLMTKSLIFFANQKEITDRELQLIINVWMYYSPTDYKGLHNADKVFYNHKEKSLEAIQDRIENKKEWEDIDTSPYSDLLILQDELLISN